jgi:hypothetical protein
MTARRGKVKSITTNPKKKKKKRYEIFFFVRRIFSYYSNRFWHNQAVTGKRSSRKTVTKI